MYHLSISFYHAINVLRSKNIRPSLGATGEEILDGEEGGGGGEEKTSLHCKTGKSFETPLSQ